MSIHGTVCIALVSANTTDTLKTLDKFWHNQNITYNFAQLLGTGSHSKFSYEEP